MMMKTITSIKNEVVNHPTYRIRRAWFRDSGKKRLAVNKLLKKASKHALL